MAATVLALFALAVPQSEASGKVSASIQNNTVTYSASNLPPKTDVNVTITNTRSGSSTTQSGTSDENGSLPESTGTPGKIKGGDDVTVVVSEAKPPHRVLARGTVTKEGGGILDLLVALARILF